MLFLTGSTGRWFLRTGKIHNISPTNVRLLGLARLQNLSSRQKKKKELYLYILAIHRR